LRTISDLQGWFADAGPVLVALSGGVDSALVAYAAHTSGISSAAVTADYRTLSREEMESAKSVAAQIGIRHHIIKYDELSDEEFARNGSDRCYHCRTQMGDRLLSLAAEVGYRTVVDGTNSDDVSEYRPGIAAMHGYGIRSPLLEIGVSKFRVREMAREAGLSVHSRPSNSCLASRIPWGRRVTAQLLARIEMGEKYVRQVIHDGPVRVRDMDGVARIEVSKGAIPVMEREMQRISPMLLALGFRSTEINPSGYAAGGANL
jgi:uncharacterized protein